MTKKTGYQHPTGNKPKSIHIVCSGATTKDYLAANMGYERTIPKADEVWSLNKSLRTLKADFGFVLDDWVGEYRKSAAYMTDIAVLTKTMPIMTTIKDSEVIAMTEQLGGNPDNVVEFPIKALRDALGEHFYTLCRAEYPPGMDKAQFVRQKGNSLLYMKNSVPLILAYAWYIGVGSIYLFGADYTHPMSNAREADQPNAEYWCGFLEACGVSLYIPQDTTLKSARIGGAIYGYGVRQPAL
jgi:hypothetical protein